MLACYKMSTDWQVDYFRPCTSEAAYSELIRWERNIRLGRKPLRAAVPEAGST